VMTRTTAPIGIRYTWAGPTSIAAFSTKPHLVQEDADLRTFSTHDLQFKIPLIKRPS
jgi:hypothetical protein